MWLCVDERTDVKKNSILNEIVHALDPPHSSSSWLLARKIVEQCNDEAITMPVLDHHHISKIFTFNEPSFNVC